MKYQLWIMLILCVVLSTFALAQRPEGAGKNDSINAGPHLYGKITDNKTIVNANKYKAPVTTVTMKLFIQTEDPNVPGKVPDEMAQQAAQLQKQADDMEAEWKTRDVPMPLKVIESIRKMRQFAADLLRWRETEETITSIDNPLVPIETVKRLPFAQLILGQRLRIVGRYEANTTKAGGVDATNIAIPDSVTVIRDANVVSNDVPLKIQLTQSGATPGSAPGTAPRIMFYEIVGDVISVDPLVLQVNAKDQAVAQKVQVITARQYGVVQRLPLAINELQPGQKIRAKVTMNPANKLDVISIQQIIVLASAGIEGINISFPGDNNDRFYQPAIEFHPVPLPDKSIAMLPTN